MTLLSKPPDIHLIPIRSTQAKILLKNGSNDVQEAVQNGTISLKRGKKISRLDLEQQLKALTDLAEPRPSILDGTEPSNDELKANEMAMQADLDALNKLLEADDALATAHAEIKRLNYLVAQKEVRIAAIMKERSECIKLCKKQQYHIKKLFEEREKCPFCKENYEKNRPFY